MWNHRHYAARRRLGQGEPRVVNTINGARMTFVDQFLQFVQQGIATVFKFIRIVWNWTVEQIEGVPWDSLADLPAWKIAVLVIVAGGIVYLLYATVKELVEAGQKALSAFVTLLSVMIKTLGPLVGAGLVAAGGAWIVNNVNF
jgi:hypothetical protein